MASGRSVLSRSVEMEASSYQGATFLNDQTAVPTQIVPSSNNSYYSEFVS